MAAAALALVACGGRDDAAPRETATTRAPPTAAENLLAVSHDATGSELFWADALTLEPVDGRSVPFSYAYSSAGRSPDGGALALGADDRGFVQIVDVERMKALGRIDVGGGGGGYFERLHWVAPDLLLASISGPTSRAFAVDPVTRTVLSEHDLGGTVLSAHRLEHGLVFLLAPPGRIGPARLAVFDGTRIRSAKLRGIRAGWAMEDVTEEDYRARQSVPGLAVEPSGRRALVVPPGNRVAEVDLETLEVAYHDLSEPVSLLGRLQEWLEPAAHAKSVAGPERSAVWLPSGLVAVSGAQYAAEGDRTHVKPAGLALVDPGDWSVRRVSERPSWITFRGGALLGSAWEEGSGRQAVLVFDEDGGHRFTLARTDADLAQVHGGYLYAASKDGTRFELVDLRTGETVRRATPGRSTKLVYAD